MTTRPWPHARLLEDMCWARTTHTNFTRASTQRSAKDWSTSEVTKAIADTRTNPLARMSGKLDKNMTRNKGLIRDTI